WRSWGCRCTSVAGSPRKRRSTSVLASALLWKEAMAIDPFMTTHDASLGLAVHAHASRCKRSVPVGIRVSPPARPSPPPVTRMLSHASDELSEWMERALSVTTTLHRNTGRPGQQHQRNDLAFPQRCPTAWNAEREFGVRNRPGERAWVRRPRGSQQTTYWRPLTPEISSRDCPLVSRGRDPL